MAYATVEEFVAEVGSAEAKALAPSGATYDEARIAAELADASAFLDSYFAARHTIPLDPVPRTAVAGAIALAREALDKNSRDHVKAEADRIRAWARDISIGRAVVGTDSAGDAPAAGSAAVQISAPARRFSRDCDW